MDDIESPSELKLDKKINFIFYHNGKSTHGSENESLKSVIDEDDDEDEEGDEDDVDDNSLSKELKARNETNHTDSEMIVMDDDCEEEGKRDCCALTFSLFNKLIYPFLALICGPCGITFNSKITLIAHQKYYCINKLQNEDKNSESSLTFNDKRKKRIDSKDIIPRQKVTLKRFNHRSDHERGKCSWPFYLKAVIILAL